MDNVNSALFRVQCASRARPSAILPLLLLFGTLAAWTSQAQKYTVTQLLATPGAISTSANSMNNAGVVVGNIDDADGSSHAVKWNNAAPTPLYNDSAPFSSSGAVAINNQGFIVGDAYDYEPGIFEIGPNFETGQFFDHGISVGAISNTEVIVGNLEGHPAIWAGEDVSQDPGFLPTTANNYGTDSQPTGVNGAGVIVGIEDDHLPDGSDAYVAVRWLPDPETHAPGATVKALGGLGGLGSGASAINENGWIVGWATLGNKLQHAALWEPTTGAFDLGTLGGKQSSASAINVEGDVVGQAQTTSGAWHAVLWTHKHFTPTDLNLEISASMAKQVTLISAAATNDRCMVLAIGIDNKTGTPESFVLSLSDQSQCNEP